MAQVKDPTVVTKRKVKSLKRPVVRDNTDIQKVTEALERTAMGRRSGVVKRFR